MQLDEADETELGVLQLLLRELRELSDGHVRLVVRVGVFLLGVGLVGGHGRELGGELSRR